MKSPKFICTLAFIAASFTLPASAQTGTAATASPAQKPITIGGQPVAKMVRPRAQSSTKPQFLEADFLPGRGMNMLQIKAYLPGKGEVLLLASPSLEDTKARLDAPDPYGNEAFKIGGAILLPYANRILGPLSDDGKSIQADLAGQRVLLPANWKGDNPGAKLHSMHGLILGAKFQNVVLHNGPTGSTVPSGKVSS